MKCARCGAESPAGMRFCGQCGAPLVLTCPSCGADNPPEHKFCGHCGTPLGPPGSQTLAASRRDSPRIETVGTLSTLPGEMKQVTVMFCDIVNSTPLTERLGPEGMRDLVRAFLDASLAEVRRFGGSAPQFTGDGFMAEFDSATRAVCFALEFQNALRTWNSRRSRDKRLEFRIGINLGDVIVEPHDVFGHNVNIAARLEGMAEPGAVLVSHSVFAAVRDPRLSFEDVGELPLANINETIRGFRANLSRRRSRRASSQDMG